MAEDDEDEEAPELAEAAEARNSEYFGVAVPLEQRAKAAGLELGVYTDFEGGKYFHIEMPNGREKRRVLLYSLNRLRSFLSTPFEKLHFLGGYNAVANYETGDIEAEVIGLSPGALGQLRRRLLGEGIVGEENSGPQSVALTSSSGTMKMGAASEDFGPILRNRPYARPPLSLRIAGPSLSTHDEAVDKLERLSTALFFEIDLSFGFALGLGKAQSRPIGVSSRRKDPPPLEYPRFEYDREPATLFSYGRSAVGMPLLQYLAFYQVIEFYYPTYSQREAGRRVRNLLKEPTFRLDRDADIARVLSSIRVFKSGAFGSEREQLRAVLRECLVEDELRSFVADNESRRAFLTAKQKGITALKLSLESHSADIRNEAADLIYDLRCKIVHSKDEGDDESPVLLPFSEEADRMRHYIELVQFVAQKVLVASSAPLR